MQGFNMGRYVPPEHEGTTSANKLAGKHALGSRARKVTQGILTVRFEMPFPIWCTTCPKPTIIGQGVRFNAEKMKVGNYHSTPILSFRMKHIACGGWIEIRTDPKNTAYVVTEGAKKRDTGDDKHREGEIVIKTDEERERLQNDAFAALEGRVEDKRQTLTDKSRIEDLHRAKEKDWHDPFAASQRLRRVFRVERKVRHEKEGVTEALKERMGLGIEVLEETEEDRRRAGFVEFGVIDGDVAVGKAVGKGLFEASTQRAAGGLKMKDKVSKENAKKEKSTKAVLEAEQRKERLRIELRDNTRAVIDPFLNVEKPSPSTIGAKRKREIALPSAISAASETGSKGLPLVDYDSD